MISRKEILFFIAFLVAGAAGAWMFMSHVKSINNTPEKVAQRTVNQALQEDICDRIATDLRSFKDSPSTFQRTSLRIIELETKQSQRRLLLSRGVPDDFPLEYRGDGSIFSSCLSDAKAWLNIPSAGSQSLEEEQVSIGLINTPKIERLVSLLRIFPNVLL
jgi:hypothetical protein